MNTRQRQHLNILVTGRVQGVFYRKNAARIAQALGVTGYVRNNQDGSVRIEAEGDLEALNEFIDLCSLGSKKSKVARIETESGGLQHFDTFRIV